MSNVTLNVLKRCGIGGAVVLLLGSFLFGTDLFSYLSTATGNVRDAAKSNVPIEFELERATDLLSKLEPEIETNQRVIVEEESALVKLEQSIKNLDSNIGERRSQMARLAKDLNEDSTGLQFTYAGKSYTRQQVESDLANRLDHCKIRASELQTLRDMHAVRTKSLQTSRTKFTEYTAQKRELTVAIEQLRARQKLLELAQTTSEYNFDDSQLGKAKELIASIGERLEVEERMVGADSDYTNEVILTSAEADVRSIQERVASYLNTDKVDADKVEGYTIGSDALVQAGN